jgi:hypothetical protein
MQCSAEMVRGKKAVQSVDVVVGGTGKMLAIANRCIWC